MMGKESNDKTFELKVRFVSPLHQAATKRQVLMRLTTLGVTDFAEGMIDGIDETLVEGSPEDFDVFGDQDSSPVMVYDFDGAALEGLRSTLAQEFGEQIETTLTVLATEAWSQAWNERVDVISTERFFVQVNSSDALTSPGKLPLRIATGSAFGSGRHATTEVCLKMLETLSVPSAPAPRRFLDVGTGTGILAFAAAKLGFSQLVGTDIDADVLREAEENARANGVTVDLRLSEAVPAGTYDVVAANILAPVLHALMPTLAAALAPGGVLLLAGFIDKEATPLEEAASRVGLRVRRRLECRSWIGLELVGAVPTV